MHSKDGTHRRRRAPHKIFTGKDAYTIHLPSGERELIVEHTLASIEDRFVRLRDQKISRRYTIDESERADLCIFIAAMSVRTDSRRDAIQKFANDLHRKVVAMEEQQDLLAHNSNWTGKLARHAHQFLIAEALSCLPQMLFEMQLVILETEDVDGFLTSDDPCVWWNPKAYKMPPFYRAPGLAQSDIEVTLPLSPRHLAVISHHEFAGRYKVLNRQGTDEMNRRTRAFCADSFVSGRGSVRQIWFELGDLPDDGWEKVHREGTPEDLPQQ